MESHGKEKEGRFSHVHAQLAVYKGRIYAAKASPRPYIELNRKLKKELKVIHYKLATHSLSDMHSSNFRP